MRYLYALYFNKKLDNSPKEIGQLQVYNVARKN